MFLVFGIILSVLLFWAFKALLDHLRFLKASAQFYALPKLPLIGHAHLIPKDPFEIADFLIRHGNQALHEGHNMICWWFGTELNIWMLDGKSAKIILEHTEELTKSKDYAFFEPWLGDGLLLSDGVKWRRQRRMLTPTFHFAKLEQYISTMNGKARQLVGKLGELEGNEKAEDISALLARCSLDIAAEAIMGVQLDTQQSDCANYVKAVGEINRYLHDYVMNPVRYFFTVNWYLFGYGFAKRKCLQKLKAFTRKVIEERIKLRTKQLESKVDDEATLSVKKKAFLDMLLEMESEGALNTEELREQVDTFMFAGHDTTAHGLIWTLWCLACHPDCQQRVHAEIDEKFGSKFGSIESDEDWALIVNSADLNELRYLDRCIRESLRIFPAVPIMERQLQNDVPLDDGRVLPKGALIAVPPILIHHNEKAYPNHWEFNPDNFLPEEVVKRDAFDYIPFSAGLRNCIGQKFAMLELKIVLAHILWHFNFTSDVPFLQNRLATEPILRPQFGVPVFVRKRK